METCEPLTPGTYAFCEHTLLLDGVVREVFIGKWLEDPEHNARHLHKFPNGTEVDGGIPMCIVTLKRPISIAEFKAVHRAGIHPVVSSPGQHSVIHTVLLTNNLAATLPNSM